MQHYIKLHSVFKYASMFAEIANMQDIINLVMRYFIKSEIIGSWLYCFTSPLIGCQLETIGFWYSKKHNAYIYSGTQKFGLADQETLDKIRVRLGSQKLQEVNYVCA